MRRLLLSIPALGLLLCGLGCNHTAGVADCEIPGHRCFYCDCNYAHSAVAAPAYLGGPSMAPTAMPSAPESIPTAPKPIER